jgi:NAD(P)-dependent dehydrogenase (short-subunit alcohol dehydrogenase family)
MNGHSFTKERFRMAWTTADIPDQTGRVAVVTGANGGLGLETAQELARKGAHVVMAARNFDKAEQAEADILGDVPDASLELQRLDLASLASVRTAADRILSKHQRLDLLINNAGVMALPEQRTEDGFEMQFGTNHLGHFAFTALLMPAILRSPDGRVVTVTSSGRHYRAKLDPDNPHLEGRYAPWRAYGQSKMANVHFALELQQRLAGAGSSVQSLVADPGFSSTDLQANSARQSDGGRSQRFFHIAVRRVGMSPAQGALPQLRAATDPGARGGELYSPRWVSFGPPDRRPITGWSSNSSEMANLWEVSERETGTEFDVAALVEATR